MTIEHSGAVKSVMWKGQIVGLKHKGGQWLCYHTGCTEVSTRESPMTWETWHRTTCKRCGIFEVHRSYDRYQMGPAYFGPDVRPWDARRRD